MHRTGFLGLLCGLSIALGSCQARVAPNSNAAANHVLSFSSKDFKHFATKKKDDLALAVLLTASTPRCEYCGLTSEMFAKGVELMKRSLKKSDGSIIRDAEGRAIIFAEVDVLRNNEVGQMLGIQDVPHLYVLNSKNLDCTKGRCSVKSLDLLVKTGASSAPELWKPLLAALGREDIWERHFKPRTIVTRARLAAAAVTIVLCTLPFLPQLAKVLNKHMWIVGATATIIYALSTSGIIYNWQNNAWRLFGRDMYGETRFVHPASRSQYLGEGFVFAFANVLISSSFHLIVSLIGQGRKRLPRSILTILLFAALGLTYMQVCKYVHDKVGYIMYPLLPPDNSYSTGGPRRDKHYTT